LPDDVFTRRAARKACVKPHDPEELMNPPRPSTTECCKNQRLALAARFSPRLRIDNATVHPQLSGNRGFLRALRAAEMAAWEASLPLELSRPFAEAVARSEQTSDSAQQPNSFGTFFL
jgi:hypothetical protein